MQKWFKMALSFVTAGICMLSAASISSVSPVSTVYASDYEDHGILDGDYFYCWNQNKTGEFKYENTGEHGFEMSWDGIENAMGFKGALFDSGQVYAAQIKEYSFTYDADIDFMGEDNTIGIHGWMENPDIDFYIIDGWGRSDPNSDDPLGTVESNGITYNIYKRYRYTPNSRSVVYYSVAQENLATKTDGICNIKNTINVADHLKAWCNAGLELGYIFDLGFQIDAYRSSGFARLNSFEISSEITPDVNYGPDFAHKPHAPLIADEKGRTIYLNFESEKVGPADGNAAVTYDTEHFFSGERSVLVSRDGENGQFFEYNIDPFDFSYKEGVDKDLIAGMKIYHNGSSDVQFRVELATTYKGHQSSEDVCYRTISPGGWKNMEDIRFKLSNDAFTSQTIRITSSGPVDFCVDDFYIADANDYDRNKIHIRGDVNDDNRIDIYDVIALRKELIKAEGFYLCTDYDINGDCVLDLSDLVLLKKYILGNTNLIPVPETETVLEYGNFNKKLNGYRFNIETFELPTNDVKTVVRSDGTFAANWSGMKNYELTRSERFKDFDEIRVKYSGSVKTTPHTEYNYKKGVDLLIVGGFIKNESEFLYIDVYKGYKKREEVYPGKYIEELDTINIGEKTYYIDTETLDYYPNIITTIALYDTDTFNKCGELNDFEGDINFTEMLEALDKEDFKPRMAEFNFNSEYADGYVDFNELSFSGRSRSE